VSLFIKDHTPLEVLYLDDDDGKRCDDQGIDFVYLVVPVGDLDIRNNGEVIRKFVGKLSNDAALAVVDRFTTVFVPDHRHRPTLLLIGAAGYWSPSAARAGPRLGSGRKLVAGHGRRPRVRRMRPLRRTRMSHHSQPELLGTSPGASTRGTRRLRNASNQSSPISTGSQVLDT